ncbi:MULTISPECIES: hypothetical protein [Pandoraea]|uniref:Uncharacterized protein n=2 Tax=Pandoraea TaxID=93217 RepID=A0A5E4XFL2_9BURK|nr:MULTISPECIES: hypothetical protein [Pandoraea]VVE17202.1 hypothetical protein PCE31107_02957 [Pandoraea cepalis]VVE34975.1 hypothetical protein PTE31013_03877 [Pandoraea terrigena]
MELIGVGSLRNWSPPHTVMDNRPGYTFAKLEKMMTKLDTTEEITQHLIDSGFTEHSTGGGFSAWFLQFDVPAGRWQVMLTDMETDTACLKPGKPAEIALYGPEGEGAQVLFEVLSEPAKLPEAIARFTKEGEARFGAGTKVQ